MWRSAFDHFLKGLMTRDRLIVRFADGSTAHYGPDTGQTATLHIKDDAILRGLCLNPVLALGEGYMDERIGFPDLGLLDTLKLLQGNRSTTGFPAWLRALNLARYHMRRFIQRNRPDRARANVAHHYDISDAFYALFLDADMQYSCAYFPDPDMTLEAAQDAKKAHIIRKLCLRPGDHVLDIGCGWGGMALTLARDHGVRVTGITLSEKQLQTARTRAAQAGLSDKISFRLEDYRKTSGSFDRIVSIGMLEHVGVPNYGTYFQRISDLLAPDGVALIHSIGRSAPPARHDPFLNKYIFPGGYVPSLSELAGAMEYAGLWQTDIEIWRLHYAKTLRHWLERFNAARDQIRAMHDDRFIRMFEFYFTICLIAFEDRMQGVYQFQLAKNRSSVPLTRDYLYPNSHPQGPSFSGA
ncbi:SAM-dependent methyltransferase [uncultured Sulfitobacter sp.]|uniref:SAM-dependent methyltransferase n=1 Tax=Sulfitobacter sp. SH22 TaxID=3421172 RepID=UPI0025EA17C4|nr:cyclopropane-fatty-acyl-phospholipid synthase family protein [uncultured Sulfitobacter sp.]